MDQKIIELYDRYTHGFVARRDFLERLAVLAGGTAAASALLPLLHNNYALAETIAESDPRISGEMIAVPGVPDLKGYLVKPKASGKRGGVLVIHENKGLTPHIKDVTRRVAVAGFTALGVDFLSPVGGTPTDEDKAIAMIRDLKAELVIASSKAAIAQIKGMADGNAKAGVVGFCWGGGAVNNLAVADPTLDAGVAYYGVQPSADKVPQIKAPLMLHYGALDERIDAGIPAFEAALKADGKTYEIFVYDGANHAFNNDTNAARYNKAAADLAWSRTLAFFHKYLA